MGREFGFIHNNGTLLRLTGESHTRNVFVSINRKKIARYKWKDRENLIQIDLWDDELEVNLIEQQYIDWIITAINKYFPYPEKLRNRSNHNYSRPK